MRKKITLYFIFTLCFLLMISFAFIAYAKTCSVAHNAKSATAELQMMNDFIDKEQQVKNAKKTLVVYYSYTDDTRRLANMIHEKVGGDIFEIQPLALYSSDYDAAFVQGRKEVEERFKPQLRNTLDDIAEYGIIYIGSPIWFNTIAPPVASFLFEQRLAGKTIIPFFTYDGDGVGHSMKDIVRLSPNAKVAEGFSIKRSEVSKSQGTINKWLNEHRQQD